MAANQKPSIPRFVWAIALISIVVLVSLFLAWLTTGIDSFSVFLSTGILCLALALVCWWAVQKTEGTVLPRALAGLILLAAILRLGAGILWYFTLPTLGYNSPAEQAGYVMADAYQRDQTAWELAQSEDPLWTSFRNQRSVDQYGGFLFSSALLYRYTGGLVHQPLQIVFITATISALAVLFTWALARRIWNKEVAWLAAWFLVLFPDALLLGSSQMREAFTMTLVVMAFYGLIGYLKERTWLFLGWMLISILLFIPFSPTFAALLALMLALTALFYNLTGVRQSSSSGELLGKARIWLVVILVIALVIISVWFALEQFVPDKIQDPISMVNWWIKKSADWQAHLTERASGKIQAIFDRTPEWSHSYLLLAYGIAQPFLPAALAITSAAPIWQGIAIWRALGWTILLILLLYASIRAWTKDGDRLTRTLVVLVWLAILVASFRGGGDQWDNPRYRTTFICLQVMIAAWGWVKQRESSDHVFRYIFIWVLLSVLWFIPWYLHRRIGLPWPVQDSFKTLALASVTTILIIIFDMTRNKRLVD
jgi:hypothetical protein